MGNVSREPLTDVERDEQISRLIKRNECLRAALMTKDLEIIGLRREISTANAAEELLRITALAASELVSAIYDEGEGIECSNNVFAKRDKLERVLARTPEKFKLPTMESFLASMLNIMLEEGFMDAPKKTERFAEFHECILPIGNDHTVSIIIDEESLQKLKYIASKSEVTNSDG